MKKLLIAIVLLLASSIAQAQTYPSCAQLPLLACVAGDTITGTFAMEGTAGTTPFTFDGSTAGTYVTTMTITDPTAARTFTIPNADTASGQAQSCSAGQHISAFNASTGAFTCSADAGATHTILDGSVHTDTVAQTPTRGSIIYGNATPKWDELTIGTTGKFLHSDGTDIAWAAISSSDIGAGDLAGVTTWAEICTESGGACTLGNIPLGGADGCTSGGAGANILAFSNGLQMKCVAATPGINEYTLTGTGTTFTFGNTANSPALVYYER